MLVKSLIVSILVSVDVSALDFGSYTLKVNEEITLLCITTSLVFQVLCFGK